MRLFRQMGEHQTLPVQVEHIGRADGGKLHPAPPLPGLEQQMHLGIVAQGLKVADAEHRRCDRFLIDDAALIEGHLYAEPVGDQAGQDLQLHLAHKLHMDLTQPLVPNHAQLRILLLQLAQVLQHMMRIAVRRQADAVAEHRLEHRRLGAFLRAQSHARAGMGQAGRGADHASLCRFDGLKLFAGIQPQLVDLFLPAPICIAAQLRAHSQAAAGHLEIGQPVALRIAGDFEDPCAECRLILRRSRICADPIQQLLHALQLEGRAEVTGEHPPRRDQRRDIVRFHCAAGKVTLEQRLVAHGELFSHAVRRAKVDAARIQPAPQVGQERCSVRPRQIHFVDKQERRDAVPRQQPPERFGVRLHAIRSTDHQHGVVEHLQGALHLRGEIHMSRRIEQGDGRLRQRKLRLLGENRDPAFALERERIQKSIPMIDTAELFQRARLKQHRFRQGGLARINVRQDADDKSLHNFLLICFIMLLYQISVCDTRQETDNTAVKTGELYILLL